VRVVGVISKDGLPQADSFAADTGVRFPSAFDGQGQLMADLGLNVLPYTYLLDADGALAYTQVGPLTSVDELRGLVAEHLGVRL
jgi:peroxiredoxin